MSRRPLYKVGDIVKLKPYDDFALHLSIRKDYWDSAAGRDLKIRVVDEQDSPSDIYYGFENAKFGWSEDFLRPVGKDFLSDKDFEI